MLMTPALAMFYGGMVRQKNILGTVMQSFILIGLVSVEWMIVGYSAVFGPDVGGMIGDLSWFALDGVGIEPHKGYAATVPHQAFMIYQMMFAVITPALIAGAFAERFRFSTFLVFSLLWSLLVYNPVAHWIWGIGGWLRNLGAIDFAGGMVVHITAGVSALAAGTLCYGAVMLKGRLGYDDSLDVVGVHCVGGVLGTLATGLLATKMVNPGGADGLFYGNAKLFAVQALAAAVVLAYSFVVSYVLLKALDKCMGLRVSREDEIMGLDLSEHGEAGYNW